MILSVNKFVTQLVSNNAAHPMWKSVTRSMMRFVKMLHQPTDLDKTKIVMDLQQPPFVGKLRGNSVTMFQSKNVEMFQDNNVVVSHSKCATMFQASNVQMFQDKIARLFQGKWQDRNVKMFQGSLARLFQDKNANQFQGSNASRCLAE